MSGQIGQVRLSEVRLDPEAWPREGLDRSRVDEFRALYKEEGVLALPPVEVVALAGDGFLAFDGHHRLEALRELGVRETSALVHALPPGENPIRFAYECALECSTRSAKPLTRREKRAAIARLIVERPAASDREIAKLVAVDHKTVGRVREWGNSPPEPAGVSPRRRVHGMLATLERGFAEDPEAVEDFFNADPAGEAFAAVFEEVFGEHALAWAEVLSDWSRWAADDLRDREGEDS